MIGVEELTLTGVPGKCTAADAMAGDTEAPVRSSGMELLGLARADLELC